MTFDDFKWDKTLVKELLMEGRCVGQSVEDMINKFIESKQRKPDFEILRYVNPHIISDVKEANIERPNNYSVIRNYPIHSVKRLSDGSVFTLGDICFYEINGLDYYRRDFTITKFDIDRNEIRVWGEEIYNPMCELSSLKKQIVTADFKVEFNLQVTAPPQELTINGVKYKPSK